MTDSIRCVEIGMADKPTETWCGRKTDPAEFTFIDASHAALQGRNGGYVMVCEWCAGAIHSALLKAAGSMKWHVESFNPTRQPLESTDKPTAAGS